VGFAAGGGQDIVARLIGQWLSDRLGQTFLVDNRPGANGNIATEAVVKAPSDGYTLLHFSSTVAINATLYEKLNFDFIRDIAPVASIIRTVQVMDGNYGDFAAGSGVDVVERGGNVGNFATRHVRELNCEPVTDRLCNAILRF
jgi:hypothetical protein